METHKTSPFSSLPTELRRQIYEHAIPSRILQLGYDFPFPFLPIDPDIDTQSHTSTSTVYTTFPNLFHLCHESRSFCLSVYIPFAYSYPYPTRDCIYISRQALKALASQCEELCSIDAVARSPLYPLGMIQRLIVEYFLTDTTSQCVSPLRKILLIFGSPAELLFTLSDAQESHSHILHQQLNSESHICGRTERKFIDDSSFAELESHHEAEMQMQMHMQMQMREYYQYDHNIPKHSFWNRPQYNSWSKSKFPVVKLVGMGFTEGDYLSRTKEDAERLRGPLKRISEEWVQAEKLLYKYGKHSGGLLYTYGSGLLYTKENTERALEWARKGKPVLS